MKLLSIILLITLSFTYTSARRKCVKWVNLPKVYNRYYFINQFNYFKTRHVIWNKLNNRSSFKRDLSTLLVRFKTSLKHNHIKTNNKKMYIAFTDYLLKNMSFLSSNLDKGTMNHFYRIYLQWYVDHLRRYFR